MTKPRPQALSLDALIDNLVDRFALTVADLIDERLGRMQQPIKRLLDRRGLAEMLDCGVDTVDRLRREGLPELKVGDSPRYEAERVLAWMRDREAKS